jgi:hypothetical protein
LDKTIQNESTPPNSEEAIKNPPQRKKSPPKAQALTDQDLDALLQKDEDYQAYYNQNGWK